MIKNFEKSLFGLVGRVLYVIFCFFMRRVGCLKFIYIRGSSNGIGGRLERCC